MCFTRLPAQSSCYNFREKESVRGSRAAAVPADPDS